MPTANAAGSSSGSVTHTGTPKKVDSTRPKVKAPHTARLPCARFTMRMTPNVSESPHAMSAYSPPSSMP